MAYIGKSPTGTGVRSRFYYTATAGATSLSGADDNNNTLVFSDGNFVDVSKNGTGLVAGTDYNTSTTNTIAGLSALSAGDIVEIIVYDIFTVADTVSAKDGGAFSGAITANSGLNVGTIKEATGTTTAMTIDSTGRILTPARPAFRGTKEILTTDFTTLTTITSYTESFDIGGAFDATAGTYTVPITGIYQINIQQDGNANFSGATQVILNLNIDGSVGNFDFVRNDPQGGQSSSLTMAQTRQLTAGQVLKVTFQVNDDTSVGIRTVFSGFLVG